MVLAKAQKQTIQDLPDAQKNNGAIELFTFASRGPLLPAWGTRERERRLREIFRYDYNWMVQGAFAGIGNLIATTPRQVRAKNKSTAVEAKFWKAAYKAAGFTEPKSDPTGIDYFQMVIEQADFGRGWSSFVKKVSLEYLRHDCGAFIELIAPGNPARPPTGTITGLAVLDSLRCNPTGDPEYPVIYYDRTGKYHLLHNTRVMQIVDMPDTDERRPGYGLCALSRAISIVGREVNMGRYIESMLDDKPPPGIVLTQGVTKQERDKALAAYRQEQSNDERPIWGRQLWMYGADPALQAAITTTSFSQAPEKFDFKIYTEIDIDALALALGVDRQELWQLSGGNIGSAGQSEMLSNKSRGKTIGNLRDEIERAIDNAFPDGYDFELQYEDAQEDAQKADVATKWGTFVKSIEGDLDINERRLLLANNVESVKDAISDENGEIRVVDDTPTQQPQADGQTPPQQNDPNQSANPPVSGDGSSASVPMGRENAQPSGTTRTRKERSDAASELGRGISNPDEKVKAIQATRIDFEDAFADLIEARQKGDMNGLRFGVLARALLRRYGLQALRDGLQDGGVQPYDEDGAALPLEPDEQSSYAKWLTEQSAYVTVFGSTITEGSEYDPEDRAAIWANKSLMAMYSEGLNSADANAMLEFVGDDGEHTCGTCQRLKEQRHRSKDWTRKKLRPQIDTDNYICGGWQCKHILVRTTERAKGRW